MKSVKIQANVTSSKVLSYLLSSIWTYLGTNDKGQDIALWENVCWPAETETETKRIVRAERSFVMVSSNLAEDAFGKWLEPRFLIRGYTVEPTDVVDSINEWRVLSGYHNASLKMRALPPVRAWHVMGVAELAGVPIKDADRILECLDRTKGRVDDWMQKIDRAFQIRIHGSAQQRTTIDLISSLFRPSAARLVSKAVVNLLDDTDDASLAQLDSSPLGTISSPNERQIEFWKQTYHRLLRAVFNSSTIHRMLKDFICFSTHKDASCRQRIRKLVESYHVRENLNLWPPSAGRLEDFLDQVAKNASPLDECL